MEKALKKIFVLGLIFLLWQLLHWGLADPSYLLPPPLEIAKAFQEVFMTGEIVKHAAVSLYRVMTGFCLASMIGIFAALFLGYHRNIGEYVHPFLEILRPIPPIAWIPIAILLFGLGDRSAFFIVFLGAFFPIFTNTYFGVTSIPKIYSNVARTFELGKMVFLRKILFRYALPNIFTGLKIGIGMAWMSVIAAELIGAQSGLGYFIQMNRLLLRTDRILAGMILIGLIGYGLNVAIIRVEKYTIKW